MSDMSENPFEGIHNFRDFGGYAAEGGRVRRGKLFRSAHYATATDDDGGKRRALQGPPVGSQYGTVHRMAYPQMGAEVHDV